jgi:hypothetical protein
LLPDKPDLSCIISQLVWQMDNTLLISHQSKADRSGGVGEAAASRITIQKKAVRIWACEIAATKIHGGVVERLLVGLLVGLKTKTRKHRKIDC